MFKKILIANRGEIACRIIRTCRYMGISTVALYSEADTHSLHVEMADEAVFIGEAAPTQSYLNIETVIQAAQDTGAEAIHPGYGFLSENAKFAKAVKKAGLVFIGPDAKSIEVMGAKSASKALMEKAGVPLVPGYHGDKQDEKTLVAEAEKIGFPLLIKASAGGGGKGMRVVEKKSDFKDGLSAAMREAKSAFGDDHVLLERYLANPRHIEIQVFGDTHGNVVHLFERDCSVQRRHQKIVEEAPAPGLTEDLRRKMGEAAIRAAKAINYVGAGTVEFLLDEDDQFYFMEMNTRLQVEHPVTEEITGEDLVEWQLIVASGGKLPKAQDDLTICGHAIEVRLYAEDPWNGFLPAAGQIGYLRYPFFGECRIETAVRENLTESGGDEVSIHYDPMIAKIVTAGADRAEALRNMHEALYATRLTGLKTNLQFLKNVIAHPAFKKADLTTKFVDKHLDRLLKTVQKPDNITYVVAAMGIVDYRLRKNAYISDTPSPWDEIGSWRQAGNDTYSIDLNDKQISVEMYSDMAAEVMVGDTAFEVFVNRSDDEDMSFDIECGGHSMNATVIVDKALVEVLYDGEHFSLDYSNPLAVDELDFDGAGKLTAPMPGKIVSVNVTAGDKVTKGAPLIILEAMKMEHTIFAPADGTIEAVNANPGDQVDEKLELIAFK